ncbi:MAG: hypothetical protein CMJ27_06050 [Phycisphaerae bacterium]|nr:hypothetical protein [Phycisphaerae bacterium]OUX01754.1 MAG: hypothetical protein CBD91_03860 [Phycisphaeraceae bacterium TMED231]
MPPAPVDPRPALPIPRGLVFAASGWIAASWIIAIGVQPPLQPSSAVYTPAARMLLASMVIGGLVAWPLFRLSTGGNRRPIASALLDLATLVALFQIVVWPLRLVTSWPADRTLLVDLHGIAWLASIAGVLASVAAREGGARAWTMTVFVLWLVLPPVLVITLGLPGDLARISPLVEVWNIASAGPAEIAPGDWRRVAIEFAVAAVIWWAAIATSTAGEESVDSVV